MDDKSRNFIPRITRDTLKQASSVKTLGSGTVLSTDDIASWADTLTDSKLIAICQANAYATVKYHWDKLSEEFYSQAKLVYGEPKSLVVDEYNCSIFTPKSEAQAVTPRKGCERILKYALKVPYPNHKQRETAMFGMGYFRQLEEFFCSSRFGSIKLRYPANLGMIVLDTSSFQAAADFESQTALFSEFLIAHFSCVIQALFLGAIQNNRLSPWILSCLLRFHPLAMSVVSVVEHGSNVHCIRLSTRNIPPYGREVQEHSNDKEPYEAVYNQMCKEMSSFLGSDFLVGGTKSVVHRDNVGSGKFVLCSDNPKKRWALGSISRGIPCWGNSACSSSMTLTTSDKKISLAGDTALALACIYFPAYSFLSMRLKADQEIKPFGMPQLTKLAKSVKSLTSLSADPFFGKFYSMLWQIPSMVDVARRVRGSENLEINFSRVKGWFFSEVPIKVFRAGEAVAATFVPHLKILMAFKDCYNSIFRPVSIAESGRADELARQKSPDARHSGENLSGLEVEPSSSDGVGDDVPIVFKEGRESGDLDNETVYNRQKEIENQNYRDQSSVFPPADPRVREAEADPELARIRLIYGS